MTKGPLTKTKAQCYLDVTNTYTVTVCNTPRGVRIGVLSPLGSEISCVLDRADALSLGQLLTRLAASEDIVYTNV